MAQPVYFYAGGLYFACTHPPPPSATASAQAAQKEVDAALPIGSTKEAVETWLESQGLGHYEFPHYNERFITISAGKSVYKGYIFDLRLQMYFYFDQNGKLSKKDVRVVSIGL